MQNLVGIAAIVVVLAFVGDFMKEMARRKKGIQRSNSERNIKLIYLLLHL